MKPRIYTGAAINATSLPAARLDRQTHRRAGLARVFWDPGPVETSRRAHGPSGAFGTEVYLAEDLRFGIASFLNHDPFEVPAKFGAFRELPICLRGARN